jgi:hypothetical protein
VLDLPSQRPRHMPIDHEAQACMCLTQRTTHYALGCIYSNSRGLVPWSRSTVTIASSPPRLLPSSVQVARHPTTASSDQYRAIRQQEYKSRTTNMARVYADINAQMPRAYWDYDSVNISWGLLENYEVVRKIGTLPGWARNTTLNWGHADSVQAEENTQRFSRASTL